MALEGKIKIECGDCGQQFDVDPALRNKMVECGECKHQFRVNEESIVKAVKRHFPGEKSEDLSMFSKKIDHMEVSEEVNFRTAAYDQKVDPNSVMPLGAKRVVSIFVGVLLSFAVILVYVLGHDPQKQSGLMLDVTQDKKFVLSGFAALMTALLVIYGCRKNRVVGVVLALFLGGTVIALPFFYEEYSSPRSEVRASEVVVDENKPEDITEYKGKLGYGAVEESIADVGDPKKVIAVVILGAKREHQDTIRGYLDRVMNSEELPKVLGSGRKVGDEEVDLFIYKNMGASLEKIAEKLPELGTVQKVRDDLRVIEVYVDPAKLVTRGAAMLIDESSANFYTANYSELEHIDLERQLAAIRRLGAAQKVGRRADVVNRLRRKLDENGYPYKEEIVQTLLTWSLTDDHAGNQVKRLVNQLIEVQKEVPSVYTDYLIKYHQDGIEPILLYVWKAAPATTEEMILSAGKTGERAIVSNLPLMEKRYYKAAASILRKVGTADAIPAIERVMGKADEDQAKALKAAIDEIKSRG